jgi:hypothetical protein
MFGSVESESGFDVGEGYVSHVYPKGNGRCGKARGVVVASNDVSELLDGLVQGGKTEAVERVDPRSKDDWGA